MDPRIVSTMSGFGTISLDGLNAKAAMLERLDNKYIAGAATLVPAFERFGELFDVLEIDGTRAFRYETTYFDDPDARAYHDHHQGRRKRCKVRIRSYVDAGLTFLEVKVKDVRNVTVKYRRKLSGPTRNLTPECLEFIDDCLIEKYGTPLRRKLLPVIDMSYERSTLVAKAGGERMTIDTALRFRGPEVARDAAADVFIVETKSARGNGIADKIMRQQHVHPTKSCSKYCAGMAALGHVARHNRFLPSLRKLQMQPRVRIETPNVAQTYEQPFRPRLVG